MRFSRESLRHFAVFLVVLLIGAGAEAQAPDPHPLAPADTSSPRATLRSFVTAVDKGLAVELEVTLSYLSSDRLYPNDRENRRRAETDRIFFQALETLDLSELPAGFRDVLAVEQVIWLSEILSRIDLPEFEDIPDHATMTSQGETRWTIPNTRIVINLIEDGPRRGEYLFSARTVARLGEFYDRVAALPYKPGAFQNFVAVIGPYTSTRTLYDIYRQSGGSFGVVPGRWMLNMPAWLTAPFIGVSVWRWFGLALYLLVGVMIARSVWLLFRKTGSDPQWRWFFTAAVVVLFAALTPPFMAQLHISGGVLYVTGIASVAVLYVVAAWAAFVGAGAIAETIVKVQRLRVGGIDSQLVRLGARLIGLVIAIALLVEGADQLGFPAYSVLTGLGVGGLAVAFAARESLANLLGSIVIMFEKPFRSGHWIKVGEAEGVVEYVGFRSTRIRTFGDSLISIPNSEVVNTVVDNLGMRSRRRQRFFVQITYDTPRDKVEAFVAGIRRIIADHPMTDDDVSYIHFNNFGESGLDILLYFYLRTPDFAVELQERETILLQVLDLAAEVGVEFAFPTRTLHIEAASDQAESDRFPSPATSLTRP